MSLRFAFMLLYTPAAMVTGIVRPLWGLYALIAMYYFRPDIWEAPDWFQPVMFISIACIAGWALQARDLRVEPTIMLSTIFIVTMVVSSALAWRSPDASFGVTNDIVKLVAIQFLLVQLLRNFERLNQFIWWNIIGNLWTTKTVLVLTAAGGDVSRVNVSTGQGGGSNYLAMLFSMGLPVLYFKYIHGTPREKKASMIIAPLYMMCVAGTGSRAGFLTLLFVVFFCTGKNKKLLSGIAAAFVMILLLWIVTPQAKIDRFMTTFAGKEDRGFAAQSRLELWKAAVSMWGESPIVGVGHDNFQMLSPRYAGFFAGKTPIPYDPALENDPRYTGFVCHSTWFQALADGGLLGVIPFFGLFVFCFLTLWRVRKLNLHPEDKHQVWLYSVILEGILWAFVISSSFGSHMKIDFLWWYFGGVGALRLIALEKANEVKRELQEAQLAQRSEAWKKSTVGAT